MSEYKKRVNVILIDDDEVDCEHISRLLKKTSFEYDLFVFSEGQKAIDFLLLKLGGDQSIKQCYLIILDLNLPSMNGFQIIEKLEYLKDECCFKVHIFTTSNNIYDRRKAELMGIENYYLKQNLISDENFLKKILEEFISVNARCS